MRRLAAMVAGIVLSLPFVAQDVRHADLTEAAALPQILNFEDQQAVGPPVGWLARPPETIFSDDKIVHGGRWAARLERNQKSPDRFSTLHRAIAMDFAGGTIELRGFLRLEQVEGFAGLWMREDGAGGETLAFENMASKRLQGTSDWAEYSIALPSNSEGRQLFFGVLLSGTGKAWVDDLQLLVDGKPVWQAAKVEREKTVFDADMQFDEGSGLDLTALSPLQVENLFTLGKVWGFLKYHHPLVAAGKSHWDYELFRVLPGILQASDRTVANAAMLKWINRLGPVPPCTSCARLEQDDLELRPDVKWIEDQTLLGAGLSTELQSIYRNRPRGTQFYIGLQRGAGNPEFTHELAYSRLKLPDGGFQLLSLYRFWNVVEYWSPYRDILGEDWDKILAEFIPRIALAKSSDNYQRELMALIARLHDGHANLWSPLKVQPPTGDCQLPVRMRFVEKQAVVTELIAGDAAKNSGLAVGDVISELDGVPVASLIERWAPYYPSSNEAAQRRDMARTMTRGDCGEASLLVQRGKQNVPLKTRRVPAGNPGGFTHDLPGETFRMLSSDVAYLKLSSVKAADASHYVQGASAAKALIVDIRNYPAEFMVFSLGSLLVNKETAFARFTQGDLANPGAFYWKLPVLITPAKPHFGGKVVILVDEVSQSQAEYTTMAFRAAPGAVVVGSTTAGADGNVSRFRLPGGFSTMISGIGVFYPDKRPTQRIGIVPDVAVSPTIEGIRAGRDEVLEEALRQALGRETPASEIEKLAKAAVGSAQ